MLIWRISISSGFSMPKTGISPMFQAQNRHPDGTTSQYASISAVFLTIWFLKTHHYWEIFRQSTTPTQIPDSRRIFVCFSESKVYGFGEKLRKKFPTKSKVLEDKNTDITNWKPCFYTAIRQRLQRKSADIAGQYRHFHHEKAVFLQDKAMQMPFFPESILPERAARSGVFKYHFVSNTDCLACKTSFLPICFQNPIPFRKKRRKWPEDRECQ